MKCMLKTELAAAAGVSPRTFSRWLRLHREKLQEMGISPTAHLIPPVGVKYICHYYGIDERDL